MEGSFEANAAEVLADAAPELNDELPVVAAQELSKALKPRSTGEPVRLPRRVAGGFRGLEDEMERRGREWTQAVRLLEQYRIQLEAAEGARDALYGRLKTLMPEVQDSGRSLKAMLDTSKSGDVPGNLTAQFEKSMRTLEELEETATALNANLLWVRSAWEQYGHSVAEAQKMRDAIR